jgi:L-amino acid N-acyltransferase YncA
MWLITLAGLASIAFFLSFYDGAFPTAAIDLDLSRAEVARRGQAYLETREYDVAGFRSALTFTDDFWASIYLQRTLGVAETNRLIRETDVPIYRWRGRWFRPLQKEEFWVSVAPDGRVIGFEHALMEDAPGPSLSQDAARALARDYLSQDRYWDLGGWEEISASSEDRPGGRTDHHFTWRHWGWDVGESELRLSVTVQGHAIGNYTYWLKVPEAFQREFVQVRDVAAFVDYLSTDLAWGLLVLAVLLALWRGRWRLPPSAAGALAPALVVGGVSLLSGLNRLPLTRMWYDTTQEYTLFWVNNLSGVVLQAVVNGLSVFLLWYLGHWMSKHVWPRQDRILSRRGDRWITLARSAWRGLMLGGIFGGYVVIFYLVVSRLAGGWTPMTPEYRHAYATPLPFLEALEVGVVPAMTEELMYRLLLISAVLWLTRTFTRLPDGLCRALAVLVPGALWGLAHLTYIRDPFYLRGIELTLAGVFLEGLFFLAFDLTTTVVAHAAFNAALTTLPLLRSGEPYSVASGVVVVLVLVVPVVPGLVRAARRRWRRQPAEEWDVRIRRARADDRSGLERLGMDGLDWSGLLADPQAVVICLEAGRRVVGVAVGRREGQAAGRVLAVYVAPAWRRRYWGSELMERLCVSLRDLGARSIWTEVEVQDRACMRFMTDQRWRQSRVVFRWPPSPPALPGPRQPARGAVCRREDE